MRWVVFFAGSWCVTSLLLAQPKLLVSATEIFLGKIMSGETATGKIVLTNIGNDSLLIHHVQPTCGCTAVKQPKKMLLPKESDTLEIALHSSGFQGRVTKFVNITTNDPSTPQITVKLIADVDEIFTPENRVLWLGEIPLEESVLQTFTLTNSSGNLLTVKNVLTSSAHVNVTWKKATLKPAERYTIEVAVQAKEVGFRNEYVWIETNHPKQSRYEVRLSFIGKQRNQ